MSDSLILQRVRTALEQQGTGVFCIACGKPEPQPIQAGEGQQFLCSAGHLSPRAFIFDGKARYSFAGQRLIHETVGALVQRPAGGQLLTLLFLRRKFPFQYTVPAGHLEVRQAAAEVARELEEETGLTVTDAVPAAGTPRLSEEGRIIGWYRDSEIQELADQRLLTAPVQTHFQRLRIIRPRPDPQ